MTGEDGKGSTEVEEGQRCLRRACGSVGEAEAKNRASFLSRKGRLS